MMTLTAHLPHDWRMVPPEVKRHGVIRDDHGARVAAGHLRVPPTSRLLDRRSGHCPARKLRREAANGQAVVLALGGRLPRSGACPRRTATRRWRRARVANDNRMMRLEELLPASPVPQEGWPR